MGRASVFFAGVVFLSAVPVVAIATLFASGMRAQEPQLTVTPNRGPVGTTVVLEGSGCSLEGAQPLLVFQGAGITGTATEGAEEIRNFPVDEQGQFRITYIIPSTFAPGSLQGRGGGPLNPGNYEFITKPPICTAPFVVTGGLPRTGGEPRAGGGLPGPLPLVFVGVVALLAGFLGIAGARSMKTDE